MAMSTNASRADSLNLWNPALLHIWATAILDTSRPNSLPLHFLESELCCSFDFMLFLAPSLIGSVFQSASFNQPKSRNRLDSSLIPEGNSKSEEKKKLIITRWIKIKNENNHKHKRLKVSSKTDRNNIPTYRTNNPESIFLFQ